MPKMKTNSGAKKRFRVTGSGKIRMNHSFKRHILTKKGTKQKRNLGYAAYVSDADQPNVEFLLTIGK
ncbi:MAG TPA: 50S ribosomal protein L35 [Bacteroidia bacterium]|jgi:large subunit ribosomal protein L35|nr:50S ribosomal protein L35 [Bacteroidia bacterium]